MIDNVDYYKNQSLFFYYKISGTSPDYTEYFSIAESGICIVHIIVIFISIFAFVGYQIYKLENLTENP